MRPLEGIRVLDFSTLLPGPLATLMLAEAGAEVIKIERPPMGDGMRAYSPKVGRDSLVFAQLNRGKRSIALDLKQDDAFERLLPLLCSADVLLEQFRPGVMEQRFWDVFCERIGLPVALRDDSIDPAASRAGVSRAIGAHTAEHWCRVFQGADACVSVVATLEEAFGDAHYQDHAVFSHTVVLDGRPMPAAPVPVDAIFRDPPEHAGYPDLGEANDFLSKGRAWPA